MKQMLSKNNNKTRKNAPVISGLILSIVVGVCLLYGVVTRGEIATPKKSTQEVRKKIAENPATKAHTEKWLPDQKDQSYSTLLTRVVVVLAFVSCVIYAVYHYSNVVNSIEESE